MFRKAAVVGILGFGLSLLSPAVATHPSSQGTVYVGGVLTHCLAPSPSEACVTIPDGATGWTITYTKTVTTNSLGSMKHGNKLMVYGNPGTVNQPFTVNWTP